ncbi:MAG: hypothetical protein AAF552_04545 [Pseudomonadota bacterium]
MPFSNRAFTFQRLAGLALMISAAVPALAQNAYPPSCFEPGPLPTLANSYVEGTILFEYSAVLPDATAPRGISVPVQIRSWRVPCHTNGSALLIEITPQGGLPLAPLVDLVQNDVQVPVRVASEANTLTQDDSGRQLIQSPGAAQGPGLRMVVESSPATDNAGIDFDDELTLIIQDVQFLRTLDYPAYSPAEYGVPTFQQISARHAGSWFNRVRDGEGVIVEVSEGPEGRSLVVSWYTYLGGRQQWLIGSAPLPAGARELTVPVIRTSGADFGPAFDRNDVQRESWGSVTLRFLDCQQLEFSYDGADGIGELQLQRLTSVSGLRC